jgi:N-methylhydantoinase A
VAERRAGTPDGSRKFFDGRVGGMIDVPLYRRERMEAGVWLPGPAIIAEDETSTFVPASFDARIDAAGCIVMERRAS